MLGVNPVGKRDGASLVKHAKRAFSGAIFVLFSSRQEEEKTQRQRKESPSNLGM